MKHLLIIAFTVLAMTASSQTTTGGLLLTKGMTIESEIIGYKTPLLLDGVKWIKMKPKEKAATVIKFNDDVASGKIVPTSKTPVPTIIKEVTDANGSMVYTGTTRIGVTDYKLTLKVDNDTVHYLLNDGLPFPIPGKNNDTIGIWCFGVRHFPKTIEVGSFLPGYINEMNLFPTDLKTSRREYFNFDAGTGYSYSGFVTVRKTRTMQVNSITINTPYYVVAKEEVEVAGKKYTAYKLLNEQLSKSNINTVVKDDPSIYFDNKAISDAIKDYLVDRGRGWDTPEKKAEILEKMQSQTGMATNEQGYLVNLQENWYVPELGLIVKSRYFDGTGALQMESSITAIK
ncbi:MAG: hypothetical protein SFW35_04825 [Chitinophagales bacterium]|nr:hypothetical protein [Chitinophagales bacterium]